MRSGEYGGWQWLESGSAPKTAVLCRRREKAPDMVQDATGISFRMSKLISMILMLGILCFL
jgi:hypothetical protein